MRIKFIKITCYVLGVLFLVSSFYNVKNTLYLIKNGVTTTAVVIKCFPGKTSTDDLVKFKTSTGEDINARISSDQLFNCDYIGGEVSIIYDSENISQAQYVDNTGGHGAYNLVKINNYSSLWDAAVGLFIIGFLFFTFIPKYLILYFLKR